MTKAELIAENEWLRAENERLRGWLIKRNIARRERSTEAASREIFQAMETVGIWMIDKDGFLIKRPRALEAK